ncbi:MAG: DUF998 domain-containing protein [Candidatus Hodarchaeota archaeon]
MEKIERFYEKINGGYFFFIGVAISIVTIVISIVLYTATGATYSIFTNTVSDLGAISSPNNAYIAFNTGLILNGILSPFGTLFLVFFFKRKDIIKERIIRLWFIISIISAISTFLVALFPEDTMLWPHNFAAFITFASLMLYNLIFGIIALRADKIAKYHAIPGFTFVIINITFMITYVSNVCEPIVTFLEWMILFGGWAVGIYLGIFCLKAK